MHVKFIFFSLLVSTSLLGLDKVSLQLKWHHQFQFAGYYAALEQGYYRDEGLDVTIIDRDPAKNNIEQVLNGEAQYGIADSVLLLYQEQKKPIVMVAPIFQHSPNVLITLKSSGIDSPYKLVNKRISLYPNDADGLPIFAMLHETGVTQEGFERIETHFDIRELTQGKADAIHGYATNEPYLFRQQGFEVNILYPQNYGVDFYGDILFTTQNEWDHNPQRIAAMKRATIKGWAYAIAHKEEIIHLIQSKYNKEKTTDQLLFEADGIIASIAPSSAPIGTLDSGRLVYMQKLLLRHELIHTTVPLDQYIYRDAQISRLMAGRQEREAVSAGQIHLSWDRIMYVGGVLSLIFGILFYYTRKLQNREETLRTLSHSLNRAQSIAHLGNWEWDIKKGTLWWSDEIYRIFGLKPQAFQATYEAFLEYVHEDDREMLQEAVNLALTDNIPYHCMHRIVWLDGTVHYVLEEGFVERDENQNPIKMMGTVHDITERKKSEILLAEKEGSLQTLLDSVAEGIYGVDVNGFCTFVNHSFLRILKFENEDEVLGKHIHELIHHSHQDGSLYPSSECKMYKANQTNQPSHVDDEVFWCKDGSSVPVEYWSYPVIEEGKFVGAVATFLDVTERIAGQKQLLIAKDAAEASARAKSEFLAAMSHEIRTPMNGVLGMLGLLEHSNLNALQRHRVHVAQNSATSLLGLINDILDFSKIEAGKMDLEMLEFNLQDELEAFVEVIGFKAHEKGLEVILNTSKIEHHNIIADPGRLRQILTNLVSNAIKFTHEGKIVIDVSLSVNDENYGRLHIDITDSGIGISSDKLKTLFDPFTQADGSTTRKYGGTGLGLSIVKRLCELMNGSIHVVSSLNEGSTFSVDLEVGLGDETLIHSRKKSPQDQDTSSIDIIWPADTRILLVEDNPTNQIVAQGILETIGLSTDIAVNGIEAIASIRMAKSLHHPYSIVLMDCQMPEMDGYDATRAIRAGEAGESNKTIPIIAMTANAMSGDREKCFAAGMDDYITKPVSFEMLKSTLMKWIMKHEEVTLSNPSANDTEVLLVWNAQEALSRMGSNSELLDKIIRSFVTDGQKIMEMLKTAIVNENIADIQLHAHSMKGACGNVGAQQLQAIAKNLEEAAKNGNLTYVQAQYAQCKELLTTTLALLETHLVKSAPHTGIRKRIDPLDMAIKLQQLKQEIQKGAFIDSDALGIFGEYADSHFGDRMNELKRHIDHFETQQAISTLEKIMEDLE